jgi:protein TonB
MSLLQQRRYASEPALLLASAAALLVTLLLFYTMHFMISGNKSALRATDSGTIIEFVRLGQEEDLSLKDRRRPERPTLPQSVPTLPSNEVARQKNPVVPKLHMAMPALEGIKLQGGPFLGAIGKSGTAPVAGLGPGVVGDFSANEDVVPLTRIAPQYPRKAALKGIEGWVKVEFTVLEDGSVADPVVLDAKPGRIFNRAATKAILRWKFRPKQVDGKPVKQRASQTISFTLEKQ